MGEVICRVLLLLISVNIISGVELCDKPADIAFVIDSSSSIWIYNFEKQIQFVQELVKVFTIGPDSIRVSALTFSHNVAKEFHFSDVDSSQEAYDRLGKIVHASGKSTFTHNALEIMRTDLFSPSNGARADVTKICILLTDGQSTYPKETLEEARLAKEAGITILAIGIGDDVDEAELRAVVSPPADRNYFHSSTFDDLKEKLFPQVIGQSACDVIETTPIPLRTTSEESSIQTTPKDQGDKPPGEVCQGKNADILFVVDMSSSIWVKHFKEQLKFLTDLVSFFDIDSGKTRVGMVTFSNATKVEFHLDQYSTQEDLRNAILAVKSQGGITNTHLALQKVRYEMFSSRYGSRRDVAHICIVITDGISRLPRQTISEANLVHKAGVDVFAIGVGDDIDAKELHYIASRSEYVFEVNGYGALKHIQNILAIKTCEVTPEPQLPTPKPNDEPEEVCKGKKEDVVFVVDMSNSIWVVDFQEQLKFLSDLVSSFDINSETTRVGLLTFSTATRVQFYLNAYQTKAEVSKAILAVNSEGGLTNTHLALQSSLQSNMDDSSRRIFGGMYMLFQDVSFFTEGEIFEQLTNFSWVFNEQQVQDDILTLKHGSRPDVDHVIIVITDGISRVPKLTATQAHNLHKAGVEVIAIGVGDKANRAELSEIASRPELVFEVSGYSTLQKIRNILATATCKVA